MLPETILYFIFTIFTGIVVSGNFLSKRLPLNETLFIIMVTGLFFPVFLFYSLSACHFFSKINFTISYTCITLCILLFSNVHSKLDHLRTTVSNYGYLGNIWFIIFHCIVVTVFLIYFDQPSEWIFSTGKDAANYVIQAAYQLEHPSLYFDDFQIDKYKNFFPEAKYKINSTTAFSPTFPFPPLNKIFVAIPMAFNLHLTYYSHLFLAGIVYWAVCILSKHFFTYRITRIITPIITISSPLFIFYSTVPMSEMLMLATAFSTLAIVSIATTWKTPKLICVAGVLLGSIFAIRIEAIIYYIPIIFFSIYYYIQSTDNTQKTTSKLFIITASVASLLFWFPCIGSGKIYYINHIKNVFYLQNYLLPTLLLFTFLLTSNDRTKNFIKSTTKAFQYNNISNSLGLALIGLLLTITYTRYLDDYLPEYITKIIFSVGNYGKAILYQGYIDDFTDYTSPFLLFTGILGVGVIVATRRNRQYFFLSLFLLASIITIVNPRHSNSPHWLVRRYFICLYPLLVISSSTLLDYLISQFDRKKIILYSIIGIWISFSVYFTILNNISLKTYEFGRDIGATTQFENHAMIFDSEDSIIVVDGSAKSADAYMLAMKYIFKIESLSPKLKTVKDSELINFANHMLKNKKTFYICGLSQKQQDRVELLFTTKNVYQGEFPALGNSSLEEVTGVRDI